jgi:hypothetical protein
MYRRVLEQKKITAAWGIPGHMLISRLDVAIPKRRNIELGVPGAPLWQRRSSMVQMTYFPRNSNSRSPMKNRVGSAEYVMLRMHCYGAIQIRPEK